MSLLGKNTSHATLVPPARPIAAQPPSGGWFVADWECPSGTVMAWPALRRIWGADLPRIREDIVRLAQTIAGYDPVTLLARPRQAKKAQRACGQSVEVLPIPVDDVWVGDTMPLIVENEDGPFGIECNFNGWGNNQRLHSNDAKLARVFLDMWGLPSIQAPIIFEGGSIDTDGQGTLMATESSLMNRNPKLNRDELAGALCTLFCASKVIWLRGTEGQDITDCHIDMLAKFLAPGVVALSRPKPGKSVAWSQAHDQAKEVLDTATDARGKRLEIVEIPEADPRAIEDGGPDVVTSYLTVYCTPRAVFIPKFGDSKQDDWAQGVLRDLYPNRDIVPVRIDTIAAGGGGIHCVTAHVFDE